MFIVVGSDLSGDLDMILDGGATFEGSLMFGLGCCCLRGAAELDDLLRHDGDLLFELWMLPITSPD
jgi:hypothetical protein